MLSERRTEERFSLSMDREEFDWLLARVQNPLVDNEAPEDREMRRRFFSALSRVCGDSTAQLVRANVPEAPRSDREATP